MQDKLTPGMSHLKNHPVGPPFPGTGVCPFSFNGLSLFVPYILAICKQLDNLLVKGADVGGKILALEFWFFLFLVV